MTLLPVAIDLKLREHKLLFANLGLILLHPQLISIRLFPVVLPHRLVSYLGNMAVGVRVGVRNPMGEFLFYRVLQLPLFKEAPAIASHLSMQLEGAPRQPQAIFIEEFPFYEGNTPVTTEGIHPLVDVNLPKVPLAPMVPVNVPLVLEAVVPVVVESTALQLVLASIHLVTARAPAAFLVLTLPQTLLTGLYVVVKNLNRDYVTKPHPNPTPTDHPRDQKTIPKLVDYAALKLQHINVAP